MNIEENSFIAEIVIYDTCLKTKDRKKIQKYLFKKYSMGKYKYINPIVKIYGNITSTIRKILIRNK